MRVSAHSKPDLFERIQAAIVKGEIAPGTRISEQYLSTTFGIGRGPLREAIRRLEGRRLVVRIPHAGVRVVSLDYAELIELYHVREALEGMACRLAAQNMTEDEIAALRDVLAMHEQHSGLKATIHWRTNGNGHLRRGNRCK